jgi:hypothetical protein
MRPHVRIETGMGNRAAAVPAPPTTNWAVGCGRSDAGQHGATYHLLCDTNALPLRVLVALVRLADPTLAPSAGCWQRWPSGTARRTLTIAAGGPDAMTRPRGS